MIPKLSLLRPVPKKFPISSPFGMRVHPISRKKKMHKGIDFACPEGTPVKAITDGIVIKAGWQGDVELHPEEYKKRGYGLRVWQEFAYHNGQYYLWYGHLSVAFLNNGNKIREGQIIGLSGNTGASSGPHLHVGVRKKNTGIFCDMEFV